MCFVCSVLCAVRLPPLTPCQVHWLIGGFILFLTLAELWLGLSIYCVSVTAVVCFGLYIVVTTAMCVAAPRRSVCVCSVWLVVVLLCVYVYLTLPRSGSCPST